MHLLENLHPYLAKGKQIYLEGLATSWKKNDSTIIPFVEVSYGHHIQLLGSRDDPVAKESEAQQNAEDDGAPW